MCPERIAEPETKFAPVRSTPPFAGTLKISKKLVLLAGSNANVAFEQNPAPALVHVATVSPKPATAVKKFPPPPSVKSGGGETPRTVPRFAWKYVVNDEPTVMPFGPLTL